MASNIIPTSIGELFSFKGKLERIPYIARIVVINIFLIALVLGLVTEITANQGQIEQGKTSLWPIAGAAALIMLLVMALAQIVKRARDIGWPAWVPTAFIIGSIGLTIIAADNDLRFMSILLNVIGVVAGLALVFLPSKQPTFAESVYSRTPDKISEIDRMLEAVPNTGGNSFFTFIFPDSSSADFGPDNMEQMKIGWGNIRRTMEHDPNASVTIIRRDATDEVVDGVNATKDRMWSVKNNDVWELTPEEIRQAMA